MAILYLVFYIKEPVERHPNISNDSRPFMKKFLIDPVKSMFSTLTKPREGHLRGLLLLQIFTYGLIWFNYQLSTQEYLYMLKMFKSYDENQYAYYTAIKNSLISFFMVVFFPFIKIHESMYCILGKLIVPIKPTGCSDWKLSKVKGCETETVQFWPIVGKANMRLRGGRFFQISKICLQFSTGFFYNFPKNLQRLKRILALPT